MTQRLVSAVGLSMAPAVVESAPPRRRGPAVRRPLDFYETAPWQVDALVDYLPELEGSVWEPCVGDASLLTRLRERRPTLGPFTTNDIDVAKRADYHLDAARPDAWRAMGQESGRPDWVVTNPAFGRAFDILQHVVGVARFGVVLTVRVSFSEPIRKGGRGPWLARHPPAKRITLERCSFTANGKTDSATTEWLIWANVPLQPPFLISAFGYKPERSPRSSVSNRHAR